MINILIITGIWIIGSLVTWLILINNGSFQRPITIGALLQIIILISFGWMAIFVLSICVILDRISQLSFWNKKIIK